MVKRVFILFTILILCYNINYYQSTEKKNSAKAHMSLPNCWQNAHKSLLPVIEGQFIGTGGYSVYVQLVF